MINYYIFKLEFELGRIISAWENYRLKYLGNYCYFIILPYKKSKWHSNFILKQFFLNVCKKFTKISFHHRQFLNFIKLFNYQFAH